MMASNSDRLEGLLAHDGFVRGIARALLLDESRVDDVVQQTWIRALRTHESPRSVRAWLASIARRLALDVRRRDMARTRHESAAAIAEASPSMERILERERMRRVVVEAVARLEEPYQSAILLRFFEGLPPREMARRLGIPTETARTRVKRALTRLRVELEQSGAIDLDGWSAALFQLATTSAAAPIGAAAGAALPVGALLGTVASVIVLVAVFFALDPVGEEPPASPPFTNPRTGEHDAPPRAPGAPPIRPAEIFNIGTEPTAVRHAEQQVLLPRPNPIFEPAPAIAEKPQKTNQQVTSFLADAQSRILGTVRIEGKAPPRQPVDMRADHNCGRSHSEPVLDENWVVNEEGLLANVLVHISKGLPELDWPVPEEPAILTQRGCVYSPHVLALRAKQKLHIKNEDETTHNVNAVGKLNAPLNLGQPSGAPPIEKIFKRRELAVMFKCDIHPWMRAVVHALDHPYFAVTNEKGEFSLPPLPAGTYELAIVHERLGGSDAMTVPLTYREERTVEIRIPAAELQGRK